MSTQTHTRTRLVDDARGWFSKAEAWIDSKGKGAWIALMVLGFVFFWPVGLALLLYMTFSKNIWKKSGGCTMRGKSIGKSSGNAAFDAYKAETIARLAKEQRAFADFVERLQKAKDQAEFDQFMAEHDATTETTQST